jgi:dihydrodipicolinate synthase/N-acetylneuraminate lyase
MALAHFKRIADATNLPLIILQYPLATGQGYPKDTLLKLCEESLVLGCNGLLSGSGSVIADLQARLFRAVQRNDLAEAKRLNDRIEPTARRKRPLSCAPCRPNGIDLSKTSSSGSRLNLQHNRKRCVENQT